MSVEVQLKDNTGNLAPLPPSLILWGVKNSSKKFMSHSENIREKWALPGTMSILLSTRYTVVARRAASLSIAVPGLMKCDTSAIWTPTSKLPLSKLLQCNASSISVQPGGSTEQISRCRRSFRCATSCQQNKDITIIIGSWRKKNWTGTRELRRNNRMSFIYDFTSKFLQS